AARRARGRARAARGPRLAGGGARPRGGAARAPRRLARVRGPHDGRGARRAHRPLAERRRDRSRRARALGHRAPWPLHAGRARGGVVRAPPARAHPPPDPRPPAPGGRARLRPPPEEDAGPRRAKAPTRAAPLAFVLREDLVWLLAPTHGAGDLPSAARAVLVHLERHGASFLADIARGAGLLPAAAEEALWTLVARGLVTGDGTAGLRTLLKPDSERRPRRLRAVRGGRARLVPAGRWALLRAG